MSALDIWRAYIYYKFVYIRIYAIYVQENVLKHACSRTFVDLLVLTTAVAVVANIVRVRSPYSSDLPTPDIGWRRLWTAAATTTTTTASMVVFAATTASAPKLASRQLCPFSLRQWGVAAIGGINILAVCAALVPHHFANVSVVINVRIQLVVIAVVTTSPTMAVRRRFASVLIAHYWAGRMYSSFVAFCYCAAAWRR